MGWEPKGSAASTGVHHFCQVWPWPRPEHTTEMAQDVGAGRRARLRERRGQGGREGRGGFLCLRTPPVLTGQTPEAPWSSLASGPWGPLSPYPSSWTLPWYLHHQNQGSSFPPGLRAWIQQPPPLLPAPPRLQLPHWPTTGTLRPTDTPQVTSLDGYLGTGSALSRLPWRPRVN